MPTGANQSELYSSFKNLSPEEVWGNCLGSISQKIHAQSVKTWLNPAKAVALENRTLTLKVPSQFHFEWLDTHYSRLIKDTIREIYNAEFNLSLHHRE